MSSHEIDRTIDSIARRQHGVLTRRQAREAGMTVRMIDIRLASGAWIGLARGVYALAAHPATWRRQLKAAELSVPGAAVSHRAAAALHGLEGFRPGRIELTAAPTSSGRSPLAVVHRRASVPATSIDGIAVVRLPRVLVDLAGQLPVARWSAVVDDAVVNRRVSLDALRREYEHLAPTKLSRHRSCAMAARRSRRRRGPRRERARAGAPPGARRSPPTRMQLTSPPFRGGPMRPSGSTRSFPRFGASSRPTGGVGTHARPTSSATEPATTSPSVMATR